MAPGERPGLKAEGREGTAAGGSRGGGRGKAGVGAVTEGH